MESSIETTKQLNNGLTCPSIGLGTSRMQNVAEVVYEAIKQGFRLIDTAKVYQNEKEVGQGINRAIKDNIIKRDELFIITKLAYSDRSNPAEAIKESLQKLNLTYVDLYFDHWPLFLHIENNVIKSKNPMHIVWGKMEELVKKGYTKSIGISNYNVQSILNLLSFCTIKPAFLEVEYHPYFIQKGLKECCDRQGIKMIAYNSLVRGGYVNEFHKEVNLDLLSEDVIKKVSEKYNKTPGQVALNWALVQGIIVIPRTSTINRLGENLGTMSFKMSEDDVKVINSLNKNYRFCRSEHWPSVSDGLDFFS